MLQKKRRLLSGYVVGGIKFLIIIIYIYIIVSETNKILAAILDRGSLPTLHSA